MSCSGQRLSYPTKVWEKFKLAAMATPRLNGLWHEFAHCLWLGEEQHTSHGAEKAEDHKPKEWKTN